MGLSDGGKSFPIGLAVLIQYRSVTASHPVSHVAIAITLNALAKASSLKTKTRTGLVAVYDIQPGNGAGPFLQPRSPHGASIQTGGIHYAQNVRVDTACRQDHNQQDATVMSESISPYRFKCLKRHEFD